MERLRHIFEHAQDLIYYCDADGRFTFVNPAAARVMKYGEQELIGRHFLTLIREDYKEAAADFYQRQFKERTPATYFEFPAVAKDNETVWIGQHVQLVWEGDRVTGVHAIARDIGRQKRIEEELRKSEERYRSLIQGAVYGIYRTTADGRILDANPALAHMLGYDTVDALLAVNMNDVYRPAMQRQALIERYRREGNEALSTEVTWQRRDGTLITVHLAAHVVHLDDGLNCFEGIAEDVTEKRALEEQLRQAQKMEAVGRLARGIAHDFNNVLAAILGSADLLLLRLKRHDSAREDAEAIQKAAERGAALTKQLMAFSRSRSMPAQLLDLNVVIRQMIAMLQRLAGEAVPIRVETAAAPTQVSVEPGQLDQVLLNLVVNARDAMPNGGRIDIEIGPITLDDRNTARYPGLPSGPYARIAVRDTGVGISPDMAPHVFEPFFTTKEPSKGTGLGLSIVYGIAKECGGTVTFSTKPDEGTTFEVLLPLQEGATP